MRTVPHIRPWAVLWLALLASSASGQGPPPDRGALEAQRKAAEAQLPLLEARKLSAVQTQLPGVTEGTIDAWVKAVAARLTWLRHRLETLDRRAGAPEPAALAARLKARQTELGALRQATPPPVRGPVDERRLEAQRETLETAGKALADAQRALREAEVERDRLGPEQSQTAAALEAVRQTLSTPATAGPLPTYLRETATLARDALTERLALLAALAEPLALEVRERQAAVELARLRLDRAQSVWVGLLTARLAARSVAQLEADRTAARALQTLLRKDTLNPAEHREQLPAGFDTTALPRWKTAVDERVNELGALIQALQEQAALPGESALAERRSQLNARIAQLRQAADREVPVPTTAEALEDAGEAVRRAEAEHKVAEQALKDAADRARADAEALQKQPLIEAKARNAVRAQDPTGADGLQDYATWTHVIGLRAAQEQLAHLRKAVASQPALESQRTLEAELAQMQLERQRARRGRIAEAVAREERRRLVERTGSLEATLERARLEPDPLERFRRTIRAETALHPLRERNDRLIAGELATELDLQAPENARLAEEHDRLSKQLQDRGHISDRTVRYLLDSLGRLTQRRRRVQQRLDQARRALDELQTQRGEITSELWDIQQASYQLERVPRDQARLDEEQRTLVGERLLKLLEELPAAREREARRVYLELTAELRPRLEERDRSLRGLIQQRRKLQATYAERIDALGRLETLIVGHIYWLRNDRPLGLSAFAGLPPELGRLRRTWLDAASWERATTAIARRGWTHLGLALTLLLIGATLVWRAPRAPGEGRGLRGELGPLLRALVGPAALLGAGWAVARAPLPLAVGDPLASLLAALGGILAVRRAGLALLADEGLLTRRLALTAPTQLAWQQLVRRATTLALLLGLPWVVAARPALGLSHLPRLLYTALLIAGGLLLVRAVRPAHPLIRAWVGRSGFARRLWLLGYPGLCAAVVGVVAMDVTGYRIGAQLFVANLLQLTGAVIALALVHAVCARTVARLAYRYLASRPAPEGGAASRYERFQTVVPQVSRLTGTLVIIGGVLLIGWQLELFGGVQRFAGAVVLYERGAVRLDLLDVVVAALWLVAGHFVLYQLPGLENLLARPDRDIDEAARTYVLMTLTRYAVVLVSYGAALLALQFSPSSLGWLVAALSVGLGFGLQEIVANFVSGVILLLERPVRVGDVVTIGPHEGTVKKITIRATVLDNFDKQTVIIPNKKLITDDVLNWSHGDQLLRRTCPVGVAYGTDVAQVLRALKTAVEDHPLVRGEPAPEVLFWGFGDSSLNFVVRFYCAIRHRFKAVSAVNDRINQELAAAGITIPFPQRDLHLMSIHERALRQLRDPDE